jgi:hypothetical protein
VGAVMLALAIEIALVSGNVKVTVFGELSSEPAQTVQTFSTVVIGMPSVWKVVAPGNVQ